jgi:hypothetical protein
MVSCTEFIPLYSELFKYLEEKEGHDGVVEYWKYIRDEYVEPRLGVLAGKKGIAACWEYWSKTLNEEAADFVMTYDDEAQVFTIDMRHCPSRGLLNEMKHMEPYHDYCGHCAYLYAPILKRFGIEGEEDYSHVDEARCNVKYFIPTQK